MHFILGKKLKMGQVWKGDRIVPVTVIKAEPNVVSLVRTKERDKYEAVQVALGHARREFKGRKGVPLDKEKMSVGSQVAVGAFKEGDIVRVSGVSKGRGFQGVVKRHGFHGGPKTHGQKNRLRAPGSIGSTAPQRVFPGMRMAGRMGNDKITIKNLEIVTVNEEENILMIKGAVPGARGGLITIEKTGSKK